MKELNWYLKNCFCKKAMRGNVQSNGTIFISFNFFEIYVLIFNFSCLNRADVIKVYDGRSSTAPVLSILCNEVVGNSIIF